jgi:MIZ/SP-RING zinc finger
MSVEDSREAIELYMKKISTPDLEVSQLKTPIICFFDSQLIKTPVRGILCDHPQCFSLENLTTMMDRLQPRRWVCPICKVKCFEMVIDAYQWRLSQLIRKY